uniref:Uncharacterized protein n=1 Tax=Glycine max TaxID=3847 RepID=C6THN5_SOYBN|nr:unknown [Glycine max]
MSLSHESCSLFEEPTILNPFKFPKAFRIAFFTCFLDAKYFPLAIVSPASVSSLLLRIADSSSCMLSFCCSRQS